MGDQQPLWNTYCSYFEKDFSEQLEDNETLLTQALEKWSQTKTARMLCPKGISELNDIPITTYGDYPILTEFGTTLQSVIEKTPRKEGESWWEYYKKAEQGPKKLLEGWLPDEYGICIKTTGTAGDSKWIAQGKHFFENHVTASYATTFLICSEEWGSTSLCLGDTLLNNSPPIPFLAGYYAWAIKDDFNFIPPINITDNITDMKTKMGIILKEIDKGTRFAIAGGYASIFYMFINYIVSPEVLYRDNFQSLPLSVNKILLFFAYLYATVRKSPVTHAREVLPVKGLATAGFDVDLYNEKIKEHFGIYPSNSYGSSELGFNLISVPDDRRKLMPRMRTCYYEYLDETGNVYPIDQVKRDHSYELVGTPFGSLFVRYAIGDIVRVVDFRDDGMPLFIIEGRTSNVIQIGDYFRITEAFAHTILYEAGLRNSDKWAITKSPGPEETLIILMEKDWAYDEREASKRIYHALHDLSEDFQNYVKDYRITSPQEVIRVKYLKKGAFMRYTIKKIKEGAPLGQYKAKKIILPTQRKDLEILGDI
jgi:hypothetical protein